MDEEIENLNKKIKEFEDEPSDPYSTLLSIYYQRDDLQNAFPNVKDGEYQKLIEWAISVCNGNIPNESNSKVILSPFLLWYKKKFAGGLEIEKSKKLIWNIESFRKELDESGIVIEGLQVVKERNEKKIKKLENEKERNEKKIWNLREEIKKIENESGELKIKQNLILDELQIIKNSYIFNVAKKYASYIDKLFPQNTVRGKLLRKIVNKYRNADIISLSPSIEKNEIMNYDFIDIPEEESYQELLDEFSYQPIISIIMPVYKSKLEFLEKAMESVKNQFYNRWQLCICDDGSKDNSISELLKKESLEDERIQIIVSETNEGISQASNKAFSLVKGEFTLLLDHDDELTKNALIEIVKLLNNQKDVDFIYSDEDKINEKGYHSDPFFKPNWSPDLHLAYNFPIHVSVFRTSLFKELGGFRSAFDGSQDYDMILRFTEITDKIVHIPKILYSWRKVSGSTAMGVSEKSYAYQAGKNAINEALKRRGINGECTEGIQPDTYRVKYQIDNNPLVSIIIPSRDKKNIKTCTKSILKKSSYKNFEIIIVDNSNSNEIENFFNKHKKIKCLNFQGSKFNFSKFNNDAVNFSKGEYIIFLNDDTKVISKDWIECLLEHVQRDDVGIAGAKLLYADDTVQHAGTVIGIQGHAGNYGLMGKDEPGYFCFAKVVRNCSAVTAACMMIKKALFLEIGRYDEEMIHSFQDVDLCLRVRKMGKSIIFTPYSTLYHYEGKTRGMHDASKEELESRRIFRNKHLKTMMKGDPFYNPNLSLINPYYIRYTTSESAISVLVELYNNREDLQRLFPNEQVNGFKNLIDWAATHGITMDNSKDVLEFYYDYYYNNCSEDAKSLAKKLRNYNTDPKLVNKFPEVRHGDYKRFLSQVNK